WHWSQQQYFVGVDDARVTVFRGLTQDIGPVSTSHVLEHTDIAIDDLPTTFSQEVQARISAASLGGAHKTVDNLREIAKLCRSASTPGATTAPTPTPTTAPGTTAPGTTAPGTTPTATATTDTTPTDSTGGDVSATDCGGVG
ncbi:MAG: hypothetical protein ACRYF3_08015, partial [Janthinobacterium lividum]